MQRLLAELEAARSKAQVAEATVSELQAAQVQGQQVADALAFDEETTRRRLIDSLLVAAGWKVGANGAEHRAGRPGGRGPCTSRPPAARARPITSCGATTASRLA